MERDMFDRKDCGDPSAIVGIAPQWKQKRNACAVKKWRGLAILIFRVYLSWCKQHFYQNYRSSRTGVFCWKGVLRNFAMNYWKFLRTFFLTEHLRWLLLELTHNLMISISICFYKKFCNELCKISKNTFSYTEHLRWLLLEITYNWMISISICFCNQSWFQNPCHMFQTSKNSQENTCAGVLFNMRLRNFYKHLFCRTSTNDCFWNLYIISLLKIILSNLRGNSSIQCFIFINTFVVFV